MSSSPNTPSNSRLASLRTDWLNVRRKRFWAIVAVIVYTLCGFFAVPPLLKSATIEALRERTGRDATIGEVRFNPYVLSLEVNEFRLQDTDGETLAAFDQFFVNFQLSSLFRWAWTFRDIRLDGLYLLFERFAPGDSRMARLLADVAERSEPQTDEPADGGLPRLLIHDLSLGGGAVEFRDDVPPGGVDLTFGPVTVAVQELNTLPDRFGQQSVQILLPNDAVVSWRGTIDLGPLHSEGSFSISGSHVDQTTAYLKALLPLESLDVTLSAQARYRIDERNDGSIEVALDGLEAEASEIAVTGLTPSTEFLAVETIQLSGGSLRYPEHRVEFDALRIISPRLETWLDAAGEPSLLQLVPADGGGADAPDDAADGESWRLGIDTFTLSEGRVSFTDRSIEPSAAAEFQDIEVTLNEVSTESGARIPVSFAAELAEGGRIGFDGSLTALPAFETAGTLTLSGIPLPLAQPYVQQIVDVDVKRGTLDSSTELTLRPDGSVTASGDLAVTDLAVHDAVEDRPLVGWQRFHTDRYEADTAEAVLELSKSTFDAPYGRLVIYEDQTTNLTGLVVASAEESASADDHEVEDPGYAIVVGGIEIADGGLDFSDLSLPLPFATEIRKLGGTISTIDTASAEPANLRLEGQVDEYGLARIQGGLNLFDPIRNTDITMEFHNLLMSNLSPYTVQFAGREIAEGKLDLDLQYRIDNGLMKGQNDIVMSDLVLGDKVDHPDAASLPLGLAVALLKDSNGVIDIELPVEGDVNDPQFRIGGVISQAFTGLVTKIVSAPFRLLGNLVGSEREDLGEFQFPAGRSDLTPPEMEQIHLLQEALRKRPELAIEVSGGYAPAIDVPALQYDRLREEVMSRLDGGLDANGNALRMLDQKLRSALEAVFTERFPETPLETLKAEHSVPPEDDPEGEPVLDDLAYAADLRDRLLAAQEIGEADLETLANARAQSIRDAFLAGGEFDPGRIQITEPADTESEEGEWVLMELGVAVE